MQHTVHDIVRAANSLDGWVHCNISLRRGHDDLHSLDELRTGPAEELLASSIESSDQRRDTVIVGMGEMPDTSNNGWQGLLVDALQQATKELRRTAEPPPSHFQAALDLKEYRSLATGHEDKAMSISNQQRIAHCTHLVRGSLFLVFQLSAKVIASCDC